MSRIYRYLLGVSVVILLVPTASIAFPGLLDLGQPQSGVLAGGTDPDDAQPADHTTSTAGARSQALDTLPAL